MNRVAGPVSAGVLVVILAGCGAAASPSGSGAGTSAAHSSSPPTCAQQFKTWLNGPVHGLGERVGPDLSKVVAAAKLEDVPEITSGLKTTGALARQLAAYPMPVCADPAGYWTQLLGFLKAAGDNASTSSGLGGLLLALAPLARIPVVEKNLQAELARNVGVKGKLFSL